jgi:hypothetical protein
VRSGDTVPGGCRKRFAGEAGPGVAPRTGWLLLTHNLGSDTEAMIVNRTGKGTRTVWVSKSDYPTG